MSSLSGDSEFLAILAFAVGFVNIIDDWIKDAAGRNLKKWCNKYKCCTAFCIPCIKQRISERYIGLIKSDVTYALKMLFTAGAAILAGVYIAKVSAFYQERVQGVSTTTVNVFGAALTDGKMSNVWDASDVAVPATENDMFFITTKIVTTKNQTRDVCSESQSVVDAHCFNDSDCEPEGRVFDFGWGLSNGTCSNMTNTCFVKAWCPIEDGSAAHSGLVLENSRVEIINGTENFIILIKNHVFWSFSDGYALGTSNVPDALYYPSGKVRINDKDNPLSPFFRLGDILNRLHNKDSLTSGGGVVSIRITWNCDTNTNTSECFPEYEFRRLDMETERFNWGASGYNYSDTVHSYYDHNTRHHTRSIGVLFILEVEAKAVRSLPSRFIIQLGSLLGIMTAAPTLITFMCLFISIFPCLCSSTNESAQKSNKSPENVPGNNPEEQVLVDGVEGVVGSSSLSRNAASNVSEPDSPFPRETSRTADVTGVRNSSDS